MWSIRPEDQTNKTLKTRNDQKCGEDVNNVLNENLEFHNDDTLDIDSDTDAHFEIFELISNSSTLIFWIRHKYNAF